MSACLFRQLRKLNTSLEVPLQSAKTSDNVYTDETLKHCSLLSVHLGWLLWQASWLNRAVGS